MLDFSIHLLIPAYGQFVTIKTSQGEFSFGKTLFQPETTYFTHKDDFSWQGTDPQKEPHLFSMVQPIRSPENPGTTVAVLDT